MISSKTIVLFRACLLWTTGYLLVTNPLQVFRNPLVVVLGAGVNATQTYAQDAGVLVPFVGALLFVISLQDLAVDNKETLKSVVSMRLVALFALCAASYMGRFGLGYSLVFAYLFLDLVISFLVYMKLREEVNELVRVEIRRNRGVES